MARPPAATARRRRGPSPAASRPRAAEARARATLEVFDETRWLFHRLRAVAERVHAQGVMTAGRRGLLLDLARHGPQTVPEMARARPVSRQHIQMLVNGLRDDGLVELEENPAHRRSNLVRLSAEGAACLERMSARELEMLGRLRLELSLADLEQAASVLRRLREALSASDARGEERRP